MASKRVYVDHLQGIPLFAGLTQKELQRVAAAGTEVHVPAGTVVMREGEHGRSALIVLSGTMAVRRNGRKMREFTTGDMAGEMALLDDQPRSATVECITDCAVLEISGGQFKAVIDDVPAIGRKVLATLAARIRDLDRATFG